MFVLTACYKLIIGDMKRRQHVFITDLYISYHSLLQTVCTYYITLKLTSNGISKYKIVENEILANDCYTVKCFTQTKSY
jgi:hypothetical protein